MGLSLLLPLRYPLRGVACWPISTSAWKLVPSRALHKRGDAVQEAAPRLWSAARHIDSWNVRQVEGLAISHQIGDGRQLIEDVDALDLLVQRGFRVTKSFLYFVLTRCVREKDLVLGRRVHALVIRSGYNSSALLSNHIIRMYACHGRLHEATQVFASATSRNTFMWHSIISAHVELGRPVQAVSLYRQMRQSSLKPSTYVFVAVLKACGSAADLTSGKLVHADVLRSACEHNAFVGSCLVDMYVKCGSLQDGREVFDRLPTRDVVTWTAMIAGYAQNGLAQEAITLYARMQDGVSPNHYTFACLLQACASTGALHIGKQLHSQVQERGLEGDAFVGNCLVDMYAKCGCLQDARTVFDRLPRRDVVTWTALLNGYAEHSDGQMAMHCFHEMQEEGVEPDDSAFLCLLVACSHEGLVGEGQHYFRMMVEDYGIVPSTSHYNCMVDLLGRSGHLAEAEHMLQTMPLDTGVGGWTSLLSACKSHGDLERGQRCFDRLVTLEPETSTAYVLLTGIYASAGQWRDADRIESLRRLVGAQKKPGKASIEVKQKVYEFVVGEERHDISSKLRSMNQRLQDGGDHAVSAAAAYSQKRGASCGHAEKLALAYGLLNTADGTPLLVTKNLRMCNDCHSSTKALSHLEKREIVVRDGHRVHRFVRGACSCGDRH